MSNNKRKTPYFLVDLKKIKKEFISFKYSICSANRDDIIAFAVKANYDKKILSTLHTLGSYFEVSSYDEYSMIVKNIPSSQIIVNGCIENQSIIKKYISQKCLVIIDSITRLQWLNKLNTAVNIGIRLNIDTIREKYDHFSEKSSRFGISIDDFHEVLKYKNLSIVCLHIHISNHTKEPNTYGMLIDIMCKIAKKYKLKDLMYIDVGGGYKIAKHFWNYNDYTAQIYKILKKNNLEHIKLIYEPGNAITRTSTSYITTVIDKKRLNNILYIILDGFKYHIEFSNKNIDSNYKIIRVSNKNIQKINKQVVAGCSCKSSDIFFELKNQYELNIGDMVIFDGVGAYTTNRVSNFLIKKAKIYYKEEQSDILFN